MKNYLLIFLLVICHASHGVEDARLENDEYNITYTPDATHFENFFFLENDNVPVDAQIKGLNYSPTSILGTAFTLRSVNGQIVLAFKIIDPSLTTIPNISYQLTYTYDSKIYTGNANIRININEDDTNSSPAPVDDFVSTPINTQLIIFPLENDTDPDGDHLNLESISQMSGGTAEIISNSVVFTPTTDFKGHASFHYEISDFDNNRAQANVFIHVYDDSPNTAPIAVNDDVNILPGQHINIDVLSNDSDPDGDALYISNVTNRNSELSVSINNDTLTISASADFTGTAQVDYKISDGTEESNTATVFIDAITLNTAPIAQDDFVDIQQGQAISIDVLQNDSDPDGDDIYLNAILTTSSGRSWITSGEIFYTPDAQFSGAAFIDYQIIDANGEASEASVFLNIIGNEAPIAENDSTQTITNRAVEINVLANDTDPEGDTLSIDAILRAPNNGTLSINNNQITYTPSLNFSGNDDFIYQINDNKGGVSSATVFITVRTNTQPIAHNDFSNTPLNQTLLFNVTENDEDSVDDTLTVISVDNTQSGGTFEALSDGHILFTPSNNFEGKVSTQYTVEDLSGAQSTAEFTVRVHINKDIIDSLNIANSIDGGLSSDRVTYVVSNSPSKHLDAFTQGDINNDTIDDIIFTLTDGAQINGRTQDLLFSVPGRLNESLGSNVVLDSGLDAPENGQILFYDNDKLQASQINDSSDLNNDGIADLVLLREFGVLIQYGTLNQPPLLDLNQESVYFSAAITNEPIIEGAKVLDFNNDGIDDLAIAQQSFDPSLGPIARIFYGPINANSSNIFLRESSSGEVIEFTGFDSNGISTVGLALSSADLNNDTIDDLVIGANSDLNANAQRAGQVYIFWGGHTSSNENVNTTLNASTITWEGSPEESIGARIITGDLNADGISDLIVGNSYRDANAPHQYMRAITTIYGQEQWPNAIELSAQDDPYTGYRVIVNKLTGSELRTEIIQAVSTADINNDNYSDIAVITAEKVTVLLSGSAKPELLTDLGKVTGQANIVTFSLPSIDAKLIQADINNDDFDDLTVFRNTSGENESFVIYGGLEYRE